MLHAIAVLIVVLSTGTPAPNPHALGCFNAQYPNPVIAEDNSVIDCPAIYYAGDN